jgi:hypothetical protein
VDLHEAGKDLSAFASPENLGANKKALPSFNWNLLSASTDLVEATTPKPDVDRAKVANQAKMLATLRQMQISHQHSPLSQPEGMNREARRILGRDNLAQGFSIWNKPNTPNTRPMALGPVDWTCLNLANPLATLALGVSPLPPQSHAEMSDLAMVLEDHDPPQDGNTPSLAAPLPPAGQPKGRTPDAKPAQRVEANNMLLNQLSELLTQPLESMMEANNSLLKEIAAQRAAISQLATSQKDLRAMVLKTSSHVAAVQKEQLAHNDALLREVSKMWNSHSELLTKTVETNKTKDGPQQEGASDLGNMAMPPKVDRAKVRPNEFEYRDSNQRVEEAMPPPEDPRKEFAKSQLWKFDPGEPSVNFWHLGWKWAQMQEIPANQLEPEMEARMKAYAAKLIAPIQRSVDRQVRTDNDAKLAMARWDPIRPCDLVATLAYLLSERVVKDGRNILCPITVGFAIVNAAKDALALGDTPKARLNPDMAALHLIVKKSMHDLTLDESVGGLRFAIQERTPKPRNPRQHGGNRGGPGGRGGRGRGRGRPNRKRALDQSWSNQGYPPKRGRGGPNNRGR